MNSYDYLIDMGNPSKMIEQIMAAKRIGDLMATKVPENRPTLGMAQTASNPYMQEQKEYTQTDNTMSPIFDKDTLSVNYGGEIKIGGHRNWRNNNPGNLEYGDFAKSKGAIGSDGRFAIFPDMDTGYNAQKALLQSGSYKDLSLQGAIGRYAPSSENDTGRYINSLVKYTGISPDITLSQLDDEQLNQLVRAMSMVEGMKSGETIKGGA